MPWNWFKPSSKTFLLTVPRQYLFCGSFILFLYCVCYAFVRVCSLIPCGHLLGKVWPLGIRLWCLIVILSLFHWYPGSVWFLIVSITDLCTLSYFFYMFVDRIKENGVCCLWTMKQTDKINILYFQPQWLIPESLYTCYRCQTHRTNTLINHHHGLFCPFYKEYHICKT